MTGFKPKARKHRSMITLIARPHRPNHTVPAKNAVLSGKHVLPVPLHPTTVPLTTVRHNVFTRFHRLQQFGYIQHPLEYRPRRREHHA